MKYLIINTGSASRKYALYEDGRKIYFAHFEMEDNNNIVTENFNSQSIKKVISVKEFVKAQAFVSASLVEKGIVTSSEDIEAIGIRIVAPGEYFQTHRLIDKDYLKLAKQTLKKVPLHLGPALEEIKMIHRVFGHKKVFGISDSAFHSNIPEKAKYYAIPIDDSRKFDLQKFGYHGISVQSVINQVQKRLGTLPAKIVVCHLGGGASVTAVKDGKSIGNSMGFTPLDGLVMATRVGEIDPGAVIYLAEKLNLGAKKLETYFNNHCGLLGLSGKSSDVRELLKLEKVGDHDSCLALEIYVNRLQRYIASAGADLEGIDLLVFAGIVGERSFIMRERICAGLQFLNISIDKEINNQSEGVEVDISSDNSKTNILVIKTDEMEEIARNTFILLNS